MHSTTKLLGPSLFIFTIPTLPPGNSNQPFLIGTRLYMQFTCTSLYLQQFLLGRLIQIPDFTLIYCPLYIGVLCAYSVWELVSVPRWVVSLYC